jgi:hypothetical protein
MEHVAELRSDVPNSAEASTNVLLLPVSSDVDSLIR